MIIAIDPGSTGGIVVRHEDGVIDTYKMPATQGDITNLFRSIMGQYRREKTDNEKIICFLEKVGGFTGFTKKPVKCPHCNRTFLKNEGQPGSRMFNFGQGYGYLEATIRTWGMVLESVTPQAWIKSNGLGTRGKMDKTKWKNKLKDRAQMLYPDIKVTLYLSDTLLILEHGLRVMKIKQ